MVGMLLWRSPREGKRQKRVLLSERTILHMRFACAEIERNEKTPEALLRRRVQTAAKRLRKQGVTRVVLPDGFGFGEQLEKQGLRPVSTLPLRRALAGDWVRSAMAARGLTGGSAKVAVSGKQLTGEMVRTVTELALGNRYVLLDLPYGGEDLCRQLRRDYGVSLLLGPGKDQLEGADVLVLFDPREDLKCGNPVVLRLYGEEAGTMPPLVLPPALEEQLPEGCGRGPLLAALREAGALRPGQITVGALASDA